MIPDDTDDTLRGLSNIDEIKWYVINGTNERRNHFVNNIYGNNY